MSMAQVIRAAVNYIAKTEGWFELCQISLWLRTMKT